MRLLVNYEFRSGEDTNDGVVLMKGNYRRDCLRLIHSKFKDFWGKGETETQSEGTLYANKQGYPSVKIKSWREIKADNDWEVLTRYITQI